MDLSVYAETLRRDLLIAADAGGLEARETVERLSYAIDPAIRLAVMEALSQAAAEISAELTDTHVDVRLQGREPVFVVQQSIVEETETTPSAPASVEPEPETDDTQTRVTLRLPESLKTTAEEYAARAGQSLNTWLIGAVRAATGRAEPASTHHLPPTSDATGRGARRLSGWI